MVGKCNKALKDESGIRRKRTQARKTSAQPKTLWDSSAENFEICGISTSRRGTRSWSP
jgi:hypothetical protein